MAAMEQRARLDALIASLNTSTKLRKHRKIGGGLDHAAWLSYLDQIGVRNDLYSKTV